MILAGLALAIGAVVDDAIVDVENIVRRLRQLRKEGSTQSTELVILEASVEVRGAIVYESLIDDRGSAAGLLLQGLSTRVPAARQRLRGGSVGIPADRADCHAGAGLYPLGKGVARASRVSHRLLATRVYAAVLWPTVRKPRLAYATVAVIMAAGIVVWPMLGTDLLPSFKERDFLMHWITKPGTSRPEMWRITAQACRELLTIPGVRNCGSHIGQAIERG